MIESAAVLYFLGFSYHQLNVEKLGVTDKVLGEREVVRGTAFGMSTQQKEEVQRRVFNRSKGDLRIGMDILTFLKEEAPFLYE